MPAEWIKLQGGIDGKRGDAARAGDKPRHGQQKDGEAVAAAANAGSGDVANLLRLIALSRTQCHAYLGCLPVPKKCCEEVA